MGKDKDMVGELVDFEFDESVEFLDGFFKLIVFHSGFHAYLLS